MCSTFRSALLLEFLPLLLELLLSSNRLLNIGLPQVSPAIMRTFGETSVPNAACFAPPRNTAKAFITAEARSFLRSFALAISYTSPYSFFDSNTSFCFVTVLPVFFLSLEHLQSSFLENSIPLVVIALLTGKSFCCVDISLPRDRQRQVLPYRQH
jgi:hypothetical protein